MHSSSRRMMAAAATPPPTAAQLVPLSDGTFVMESLVALGVTSPAPSCLGVSSPSPPPSVASGVSAEVASPGWGASVTVRVGAATGAPGAAGFAGSSCSCSPNSCM